VLDAARTGRAGLALDVERALRVGLPRRGDDAAGGEVAGELPTTYLRDAARAASAELVQKGDLKPGDLFTHLICAFPVVPRPGGEPESPSFAIEEVVEPLPLEETSLARFHADAVACGEPSPADVPVFVPQRILDEAVEMARAAGETETGGILVGRLHRDPSAPEIFVEVTALIPDPHTVANAMQVTFTAETWAAVDAALALRRRNEMKLGWFHSHPDFCRKCPEENRERCHLSRPFLSADDLLLHRACFGRAYHVALLISHDVRVGHKCSLFGWRRGMVAARALHVLPQQRG
jgi:proteasome lid subunit RPN8/RPN11